MRQMDICSRKIAGWEVHPAESAENSTAIAPSSTSPRPGGTTKTGVSGRQSREPPVYQRRPWGAGTVFSMQVEKWDRGGCCAS
ncbi:MAG: hypothetical protein CSB33_03450 [Desulfobacterales bacterium]|nr:MAG: hypothetical protein CSB33_03450 [Desulfobacterales bacterium]